MSTKKSPPPRNTAEALHVSPAPDVPAANTPSAAKGKRKNKPRKTADEQKRELLARLAKIDAREAAASLKGTPKLFAIVKKLQAAQAALEDIVTHLPEAFDPDSLAELIDGIGAVVTTARERGQGE